MTKQLEQIYQIFYDAIVDNKPAPITDLFTNSDQQRLDVYQQSIYNSINNALAEAFPICQYILGTEAFFQLAQQFIQRHPVTSPCINSYGDQFADFIAQHDTHMQYPYLTDIAKLEWGYHRVFFGDNNQPVNQAQLNQAIQTFGDSLTFLIPTDARLIQTAYPVKTTLEQFTDNNQQLQLTELAKQPSYYIVYKINHRIHIDNLDADEFQLLNLLKMQYDFLTVCERYSETATNDNIAAIMPKLLQQGFIVDFKTKEKQHESS